MIYFIIFVLLMWLWLITEWINAPHNSTNQKNDSSTESDDTYREIF
jgi:hypothetical protein